MKKANDEGMFFTLEDASAVIQNLKSECIRKSIHFLIAFIPLLLAATSRSFVILVLIFGIILYIYLENLRLSGVEIPFFSNIVRKASRPRDNNRFVLGPVTLGLGALFALVFLPKTAADIAILALAFGDGLASLIGRVFGRVRPAFLLGKSLEGSISCFFGVLIVAWYVCGNVKASFASAIAATVFEALPLEDYDNIVIPLAAGFAAKFCLGL
ncbi:MAG: phosphatidate cytidylyltransferase [Spirochaetaceae bacterium]|jgi:dolichol kinase|nr:phosphatidate cytidylyltransferase [Spirochaetaceae bacterium]